MSANIMITGASGGIGSAIARALAPQGRLFLVGNRGKDALLSLTRSLNDEGYSASCFFSFTSCTVLLASDTVFFRF